MKRVVLTYGLISGAILAAMMFATIPFMDRIGFDRGALIGYTTMVIAGLMIYFGIRTYRDGAGGGAITFGRAFRVGISIVAVSTVCYVAAWQVVYTRFIPDFGERYTTHALDKARAAGKSEAELAAQRVELEKFWGSYKNPLVRIGFSLLEPLPVGLVMTLVAAGILRRAARRDAD